MAATRARGPYVWLRRLLLALGLLVLAAVGVLLAAYQFGRTGDGTRPADGEPLPVADDVREQGKGFDYTQFSDGRPVFRIRAARSRQDRQGDAYLEDVLLDVYREDGESYTITSREAVFRGTTRAAELKGDVVLAAWGELELRARALHLQGEGQLLTSEGAVQFRWEPDLVGRASSLRVDRQADAIFLGDGVHVRTVPDAETTLRLDCEMLVYRRGDGVVRAHGDVYLQRDADELRALAVTVRSDDRFDTVSSLRARFGVSGTTHTGGGGEGAQRLDFRGELLEIEPDPDDPARRSVLLRAADGADASFRVTDPAGLVRELTGDELVGALDAAGDVLDVQGTGTPLQLVERAAGAESPVVRQARAERGIAFFVGGEPTQIALDGGVELREPRLAVTGGDRAVIDLREGGVEVEGRAVQLVEARAQVVAPRFVYDRDTGIVRADGGVQAAVEEGALGGMDETPLVRGEGPIRVTSEEALWTERPPTVVFRGAVRAWREQNLLLADQLRADQTTGETAAAGGVKTVWVPERAAAGEAGEPTRIEVTAEQLTYREERGELVYEGEVRVRQERRTLDCRRLTVELSEDGRAERMICREKVHLVDPAAGRQVRGDEAVYTLASGLVEVFGDDVRLQDAEKNELSGKYLRYDVEKGTAQLRSEAPARGGTPPAGSRPR